MTSILLTKEIVSLWVNSVVKNNFARDLVMNESPSQQMARQALKYCPHESLKH